MELKFKKTSGYTNTGRLVAFLTDDNWDDYSFKTLYHLIVFDENGNKHEIGNVKIGYLGQPRGTRTEIPMEFSKLDENYFSLGQEPEYYQNLKKLGCDLMNVLLDGLNDVVQNDQLLKRALEEAVTKTSLLRGISEFSIKGQFKRLLNGGDLLTNYNFQFQMSQWRKTAGIKLDFCVNPESNPPTNVHVLIGRNGVGKTHLLNSMVKALVVDDKTGKIESTSKFSVIVNPSETLKDETLFAGVVSVAFSAFDPFDPYHEPKVKEQGMRYSYIGLKRPTDRGGGKRGTPKSYEMLTNEFVNSFMACISLGKTDRLKAAIHNLETDPLFSEISLNEIISNCEENELEKNIKSLFNKMSSGHRIVLLTITKLVEKVEEKTLVLIDEPEGHLHPPLLSAFIRSLSDLLLYRNGVAIIATHSPVIVQEVPRHCVWKLCRYGVQVNADRPEIETFGENVGILTREIFGLEVTESGYHQLLNEALINEKSFQNIINYFNNNLGIEARGILRGLIADRNKGQEI